MLAAKPEPSERDHTCDPKNRQSRLSANRQENLRSFGGSVNPEAPELILIHGNAQPRAVRHLGSVGVEGQRLAE